MENRWVVAVHGGAGAMRNMASTKETAYRKGLFDATKAAAKCLEHSGSAVEACVEAVVCMEQSLIFNAGRGCCLNADGEIEADAAVMRADDMSIGALTAALGVTNAVTLAEAIRTLSPHSFLAGEGVTRFAKAHGITVEQLEPAETKLAEYQKLRRREGQGSMPATAEQLERFGGTHDEGDTVGAVALDSTGELAVAVSTGGLWMKHPGRVGDSPLPGSGFWAEPDVGVATATGTGEFIMRSLLSGKVVQKMSQGDSVESAVQSALHEIGTRFGPGKAGLVALSKTGNIAMFFDTQGMGRAIQWAGLESPLVAVWPNEGVSFFQPFLRLRGETT